MGKMKPARPPAPAQPPAKATRRKVTISTQPFILQPQPGVVSVDELGDRVQPLPADDAGARLAAILFSVSGEVLMAEILVKQQVALEKAAAGVTAIANSVADVSTKAFELLAAAKASVRKSSRRKP